MSPDINLDQLENELNSLGLRPFTDFEIKEIIFPKLLNAIEIGITRKTDPTDEDGGLLAIPTGVDLILRKQFLNVSIGAKAIACSYGGTNWVTSILQKTDINKIEIYKENSEYIPRTQRTLKFNEFITKIAVLIKKILENEDIDQFDSIGISLGFPHRNFSTKYGIDAYFLREKLPKSWKIIDFDSQPYPNLIGKLVLQKLQSEFSFVNIKRIYILNDAISVAQEVPGDERFGEYPVGFVFGTGSNAALKQWNLEAGKFVMPEQQDIDKKINERMYKLDLVHTKKNLIEHLHGGDYIRYRVASVLSIFADKNLVDKTIVDWMINQEEATIISRLAGKDISLKDLRAYNLVDDQYNLEQTYTILTECSKRALIQAGQSIGIMISSVILKAGYKTGEASIPIEGSVYWKGYDIQRVSKNVIDLLIPENNIGPTKASSIRGLAQFLMVKKSLSLHPIN